MENGFLQEVMKGWYVPTSPDEQRGDSTSWYASFWRFCAAYLDERFGKEWCLSPEQSLKIQSGNWAVTQQLLVRSPKATNNIVSLPYDTSIFDVKASMPVDTEEKDGIRIYSLAESLIQASPNVYAGNSTDIRTALTMVKEASDILPILLNGGHTVIAGRLAGAFRNIRRDQIAGYILKAMKSAGYDSRENDPFEGKIFNIGTGRLLPM